MDYVHQISEAESARISRFGYIMLGSTLVFVALIVAAFLTADSWLLMISTDSERQFIEPYIELADDNLLENGDTQLQTYVETLGSNVAVQMDVPTNIELTFRVIKGGEINAFTTLGGYVFVTESLLRAMDNENSLVMVLAHEIAHASTRDHLLGTGRSMLVGLLITALSGSGGSPVPMADLSSQLMLNLYSREQEAAADDGALHALNSRYGHIGGATQLFEVVGEGQSSEDAMEFLSTHPQLHDRIETIHATAAEQGWLEQAVVPYPADIAEVLKRL